MSSKADRWPRAVDVLTAAFAAWTLGLAAWSSLEPQPETVRQAAGATLGALGVAGLVLGMLRRRPAARRWLVAGHCVLIPAQFALVVITGSSMPFAGLAASTAVLVALRPVFPQLKPPARRVWLTLHVGFSVSWLGACTAMLLLSLVGATTTDLALRRHAYEFMHLFDLAMVIPLVLLSIVTGVVVSLAGKWGLLKHWWVLIKLLISLGIVAVAAAWENFLVRGLVEATAAAQTANAAGPDWHLAACMAAFTALLWTATALSVFKPWGRTRWGRRDLPARATHQRPTEHERAASA